MTEQTIHINGLSTSITDVFVRLIDQAGDIARHILRPSEPNRVVTNATTEGADYFLIGI